MEAVLFIASLLAFCVVVAQVGLRAVRADRAPELLDPLVVGGVLIVGVGIVLAVGNDADAMDAVFVAFPIAVLSGAAMAAYRSRTA